MTTEEQVIYLGFDCSSKAIHCVALDKDFKIITQKKWESKEKTFEKDSLFLPRVFGKLLVKYI